MSSKEDLIKKLESFESAYDHEDLSQRELFMMRADVGVLKSEFYTMLNDWFENKSDGYYYINRCQALREKMEFDIEYHNRLNKKIREKLFMKLGQSEYQEFIKDCKSEI